MMFPAFQITITSSTTYAMNSFFDGALVPVPGGVLIRSKDGELLGAVGITGDISDNDEICCSRH